MLVKIIATFASLAALMTSSSRFDPPGWIAHVAPASAAATSPSANGKNASLATALPASESPASLAFQILELLRVPHVAILRKHAADDGTYIEIVFRRR